MRASVPVLLLLMFFVSGCVQSQEPVGCPKCEECLIAMPKPVSEYYFAIDVSLFIESNTTCEDELLGILNYTHVPAHFCKIVSVDEYEIVCQCWYRK